MIRKEIVSYTLNPEVVFTFREWCKKENLSMSAVVENLIRSLLESKGIPLVKIKLTVEKPE